MTDYEAAIRRGQILGLAFILLLLLTGVLLLPFLIDVWSHLRVTMAYVIPLPLVGFLVVAILFFRSGSGAIGTAPLLLGWFLTLGGMAFDIIATITYTPDLALEGNPIARTLLDSQHSVTFVYLYAGFAQSVLAATLCIFWAGFLRHRDGFLQSAYAQGNISFSSFVKAACGGGRLTWWEYFFSIKAIAKISPYHLVCFVIPFFIVAHGLDRWYVGSRWIDIALFIPREVAVLLNVFVILLGLIIWLYWQYVALRRQSVFLESDDFNSDMSESSGAPNDERTGPDV